MTETWVLVDFDGTITTRDTTRYLLAELLRVRPWKIYHLVGLSISKFIRSAEIFQHHKSRCIGALISGLDEPSVGSVVDRFHARVRPLFRSVILRMFEQALAAGNHILVVTASPEFAIQGIFGETDIKCVGTKYAKCENGYDGTIDGEPCYAQNKVAAVRAAIGGSATIVAAWSDSMSDFPMMMLAKERFWVCRGRLAAKIIQEDSGSTVVPVSSASGMWRSRVK